MALKKGDEFLTNYLGLLRENSGELINNWGSLGLRADKNYCAHFSRTYCYKLRGRLKGIKVESFKLKLTPGEFPLCMINRG